MFEWKAQLDTGIPEIDRQHRELVRLLAELFAAMQEGAGQRVVERTLASLSDYALTHFAAEEQLMCEHAYPKADQHRAEHAMFTRKIDELTGHAGSRSALSIQVILFLRNWLTDHIASVDQELGDFLRTRGTA
jgi:hemerythrin